MKSKELFRKLIKLQPDTDVLQKYCVLAFVKLHELNYNNSPILKHYLNNLNDDSICHILELFSTKEDFSLSVLVEVFESIVPFSEKKARGVTYTPESIKKYILNSVVKNEAIPFICDPSCGCGSFLLTAAELLHSKYSLSYKNIIENYLFGADISLVAIEQTKILLSLLAILNGEPCILKFNLVCGDMLNKDTVLKLLQLHSQGFDCIIGNPPYVRSKNIDVTTKLFLSNWETAKSGNVDLYIPFFEIGLSLLNKNGLLGYISPNTYLQAINGRALRNFITKSNFNLKVVDFRDAQIFDNATNYTCISIIDKNGRTGKIQYCRAEDDSNFSDLNFSKYETKQFEFNAPWRLASNETDEIIYKIEHAGTPISHWKIRNGLATLKNDLFFFEPMYEDTNYYYRVYNGREYKIEKAVCIKIVKPNVLKTEEDLRRNKEVAIFPYKVAENKASIIEEKFFMNAFPYAYQMLLDNKKVLLERDKGNGKYEAWYAYGRTQGMNNFGKKLLIPYISGSPVAILSTDEKLLFYCGYALFSNDENELKVLKTFLESKVFWYYIEHTSKPYSKGYMSFAKNYIQNFSIPDISENEIKFLLTEQNKTVLDKWIYKKYNLPA